MNVVAEAFGILVAYPIGTVVLSAAKCTANAVGKADSFQLQSWQRRESGEELLIGTRHAHTITFIIH